MISPQTSVKVVGGYGTSVSYMLAMAFDDPSMDADLRETLDAHEIVLGEPWTDGRSRLGLVCATEGDEGLEQRLNTGNAAADVKKNWATWRPNCHFRGSRISYQMGMAGISLAAAVCLLLRRQAIAKCFRRDAGPRSAWRVEDAALHRCGVALDGSPTGICAFVIGNLASYGDAVL